MPLYKTLSEHYKERFGCKVYKLSLDGGFTCPNRDGTKGLGGCIFCSEGGSGEFAERVCPETVNTALAAAKKRVRQKAGHGKYIAYFQSFSNTYGDPEYIEKLFSEALAPDYIVGLACATRPDCLPHEIVDFLARLNKIKPITVELGLQTVREETAKYIRRGYETDEYFDAVRRLHDRGIEVVTHIIIGLPGETPEDAVNTTLAAVKAGSEGVKFHTLHVLKNTDLAKDWEKGAFSCLTLEEYAAALCECIKVLPKETVVHRITGDGAKKDLLAPLWTADKKRVLNYLYKYLEENL